MTRAAKVTYLAALFIGLAVGGFFGFQHATWTLKAQYDIKQMLAPNVLREFSCLQYRHADPEHAKAALLAFAELIEQMEKWAPEKTNKRNLVYTYGRLSSIEEVSNDRQQAGAYLSRARYWNTMSGGQDFSDSDMKAMLKKVDELYERIGSRCLN